MHRNWMYGEMTTPSFANAMNGFFMSLSEIRREVAQICVVSIIYARTLQQSKREVH